MADFVVSAILGAEDKFTALAESLASDMPGEPQQIKDAREAIATLLGRLEPEHDAEWIQERTNQIMLQFGERPASDPPAKPPG
jgi:hypothetical protein